MQCQCQQDNGSAFGFQTVGEANAAQSEFSPASALRVRNQARPRRTMETWKTFARWCEEHRLEAYGTLFSGLLSDFSRP
jgi:hypothetical protein